MSQASNFLENELFDHIFRGTAYPSPGTIYLGLYTSDPTGANSGTEVSGGAYARLVITFNAASNGAGSNSAVLTFVTATANWGTITHWGILDALTAGNLITFGSFTTSRTINSGATAEVGAGDITVTIA